MTQQVETFTTSQQAFDTLISKVATKYGAPMGRSNSTINKPTGRVFDRRIPLDSGGYDKGGAYWGLGSGELRVSYTLDLEYIRYYRK